MAVTSLIAVLSCRIPQFREQNEIQASTVQETLEGNVPWPPDPSSVVEIFSLSFKATKITLHVYTTKSFLR